VVQGCRVVLQGSLGWGNKAIWCIIVCGCLPLGFRTGGCNMEVAQRDAVEMAETTVLEALSQSTKAQK
jgi:hypothetical protein